MQAEFTAIIEKAAEGGYWAICPEIPGANGQGETIEEAKNNLKEAIELILKDRREDIQLANKVVDEVRRQEVKEEPILRNSRWCYLKDQSKLSGKQSKKGVTKKGSGLAIQHKKGVRSCNPAFSPLASSHGQTTENRLRGRGPPCHLPWGPAGEYLPG
jgi:predicted RNase H-like HicB family nuclease